MSLLRVMLIASALGSVGYGIGLVIPDLYPVPEVAPEGDAWARYLVPIYLGLGAIAWLASRRPTETIGLAWCFVLVWGGLVATHLVNMWLGDEPVNAITLGLLAFDTAMGGLLLAGIVQAVRPASSPTATRS